MKINWGTGIVITIVAFISFIMFMVVKMMSNKAYDHDFVTEKYYQKELLYQDNIYAMNNVKNLKNSIKTEKTINGLKIYFPSDFNPKEIKGKVFLYRPSNKALDFEMKISLTNTFLLVPEESLLGGRWNIDVNFIYKNEPYLYHQKIMY